MMKIEELAELEKVIRDLKDLRDALPWLIFELELGLIAEKKAAGITGPILQPPEAPPVEAVVA
ncbi:MAG: hypothetical protein CEE41_04390 [Hadesarchaea archaeon B3_Hades]|nr:MAG: hypothetical protein CEE41_04390 [Hadesarchaea archaeon B3_Hades]